MTAICDIKDLQIRARRRVPRMFYEYADSGSWTQSTYRANEADFQDIKLRQRLYGPRLLHQGARFGQIGRGRDVG